MFSACKLNLNQTSSCRCSGTWSEKYLFGATAEEKWQRFTKSRPGWITGTDNGYLRQRRVEAGCWSSAGPARQLLWAGFRAALLYSSPHSWFIYPPLSSLFSDLHGPSVRLHGACLHEHGYCRCAGLYHCSWNCPQNEIYFQEITKPRPAVILAHLSWVLISL